MRILFVAPNIPIPGSHGGSTHVTEVVRALRRRHEVLALVRRGSREPGAAAIGLGTAEGFWAYVLALVHFPAAYLAARRFRPDVIYERFSAHGLGVLLGKALGVPVVSMVLDARVTRWTLRGADRLIATAPQLVPQAYHHKLVEVSWGANTDLFRPDLDGTPVRRKLGIERDEFIFGYTGGFYPWHGLETLIEAIRRLADDPAARRTRVVLVGDGPNRAVIESRIDAAGLRSRFLSVGRVPYDEVPHYVAAFDACVAPYDPAHPELRGEGTFFRDPLKVFEYLASGKPTITLDSDNIRKMFRHGEHALLVPPGDPVALADAMTSLLGRPDRGRALGEEGRRLVTTRFTWQAHADRLTELFEALVGKLSGSGSGTPVPSQIPPPSRSSPRHS